MATEAGDFNLIVTSVESSGLAEAARQFGRAFGLDDTIASQICKSAPIIFAQKLTKQEVKAISPTLADLSKTGMEFRVTSRVATKLPKVNWPVRPQFTAGGVSGVSGLAFEWDNNAFVCPSCGESFLFRRLGKLALAEAPVVAGNGADYAHATGARAAVSAKVSAGGGYSSEERPQAVGVEGVAPLAGEGESLDLPEAMEEIRMADEPSAEPEMEQISEVQPLEDTAAGEFSAAAEEIQAEPVAEADLAAEEAPAGGADSGELYNVFLSKITDTSKRDKASELIGKVKGCTTNEAKELTTRLVIPLAKNVSKDKAEDILNQFKKLKIFGRMTKVK